jgi:serine protease inhibitor
MSRRSSIIRNSVLCLVVLLAGCHSPGSKGQLLQSDLPRVVSPDVTDAQVGQLVSGNNAFAFDFYHAIPAGDTDNLVFSPYSIWLAFSMLYAGAQGETETQMSQVLHFLAQENQHTALNAVDQGLQALGEARSDEEEGGPFQLSLANALWGQQGYPFMQPYLDVLAEQYAAGLRLVDFQASPEAARQAINAWVAKETMGRIEEIAPPGSLDSSTRLVLANAIYFKAGWAYSFDPDATADGRFTLLGGSRVTVPQMHLQIRLQYLQGEGFQAVRLPYVNQAVDMWVILPAEGQFEALQSQLNSAWLEDVRNQAGAREVILTLPRFDFESDLTLLELMQHMGLTAAFCPGQDFGGMAEGGGLCIANALHRATITVDEQGTEAAAATIAMIEVSKVEEVEMTIDRPFLFAILVRDTGLILFLGQVLDPSS